ncbi:MAG: hypothetical protein LBQ16_04670, partial [Gracilibacteraceae bacterium]|nr:hypothetical protein [Gracilibacteraceae bacterium]
FLVSTLLVPLLAGLWWKRSTELGAILAILSGAITFIIAFFIIGVPTFSEVFCSVPVAIIFQVVGSFLSAPPSAETIKMVEGWHTES